MTNLEKYKMAFVKGLELEIDFVKSGLAYSEIENWDSVAHMNLVAEIEEAFDIMLDTEDIIDFSSYDKGIEILSKYDIVIE